MRIKVKKEIIKEANKNFRVKDPISWKISHITRFMNIENVQDLSINKINDLFLGILKNGLYGWPLLFFLQMFVVPF